jgi:Flp pilus assembly protein TadD
VAPGALSTLALRAQLWCRQGAAESAVGRLRAYEAGDTAADAAAGAEALASLYDQASLAADDRETRARAKAEAERLYKALAGRPDADLVLAGFYARHDDTDAALEALRRCRAAPKPVPLEQVIATALTATPAQFEAVEGWLKQAPDSADLRFFRAIVHEQRRQFPKAEDEYRGLLKLLPGHAGARNNLAFLLALEGKGAEALEVLKPALEGFGDAAPELFDTRAVALIAVGDFKEAEANLLRAAAAADPAPAHFHLAVVYWKREEWDKAKEELRRARHAGLRTGQLHPLERKTYADMVADLKLR